jgi:Parvulin-like peptidyl-prolyl isomerase
LKDIRASHILIMLDENAVPADTLKAYSKITSIYKEVISGKDFAEAAVEYSDDPSARDTEAIPNKQRFRQGNKGDLGYFTVFNMVYPFEEAAYNTKINEISPIVRTKYGYHIIKVTDIKDAMGYAEVAHIFVALRPEASTEDSLRKVEKIENIYSKIQEGLSFEDAVVQYSEDKGSAKNQGRLSKFSSNRVVPEFVKEVDKT